MGSRHSDSSLSLHSLLTLTTMLPLNRSRQSSPPFCWPLTKRGLFSEILVYGYIASILDSSKRDIRLFTSVGQSRYWRKLFPGIKLSSSFLPSSFLLTPAADPSARSLIDIQQVLSSRYINPTQVFRALWNLEVERYFAAKFDLYGRIAEHIEIFLRASPVFCAAIESTSCHLNEFNAVHVRRGDKVAGLNPEAEALSLGVYVKQISEVCNPASPLYLIGDNASTLDELKDSLIPLGFLDVIHKSPSLSGNFPGYDQEIFNALSVERRLEFNRAFLEEFAFLVGAKSLICTFSSCVGRSAALIRRFDRTYSIDTSFSIVQ